MVNKNKFAKPRTVCPQKLEYSMRKVLLIVILFRITQLCYSQVYTEKQTRHRFAQLHLGLDGQIGIGGSTRFYDAKGSIQSLHLSNTYTPRFLIGGTHFWGHADFYIAIPLYSTTEKKDNQDIISYRGIETVFKYYPFRVEHKKIRPYIGVSLAPINVQHSNNNLQYSDGPELNVTTIPIMGGLTFNYDNHLLELGMTWNHSREHDYWISRSQKEKISSQSFFTTLSYKYLLETTIGAEQDWESGRTKVVTEILAERGRLNGVYFAAGISSAFWLKQSDYNQKNRAFINPFGISIMPDFSFGYYFHKPDINLAIGYRGYGTSTDSYGVLQQLRRKSLLIEFTKFLFDYHGFVPFVGPAISYENLSFYEDFEGNKSKDVKLEKLGYGLALGWDIRPNRIQSWILRTNLRWFPNLKLNVEPNSSISFDNLEFNFIQLIIYPNRIL